MLKFSKHNFQITKFVKENIEIFKKVLFVEIKTFKKKFIQQTCVKGAKLLQYVTLLQFFMF